MALTSYAWLVAIGVGLAGCVQLPPERARTDDCVVYSDVEATFPTGLAAACSALRSALDDELGLTRTDGRPIQMSVWRERSAIVSICGEHAEACASSLVTFANSPLHLHELVHAHLGVLSRPPLALVEGTAEAYGCDVSLDDVPHTLPLAWLIDEGAFRAAPAPAAYDSAASFVGFLIDRAGAPAYGRFYLAAHGAKDLATLDARAEETLGASVSELHAEWAAAPPTPADAICRPAFVCAAPPLVGDEVVLARGVVDSALFAVGAGEPTAFERGGAIVTLDLEAPALLRVEATAPSVLLGACEGISVWGGVSSPGGSVDVEIPTGPVFVWIEGQIASPEDGEATARVELLPLP